MKSPSAALFSSRLAIVATRRPSEIFLCVSRCTRLGTCAFSTRPFLTRAHATFTPEVEQVWDGAEFYSGIKAARDYTPRDFYVSTWNINASFALVERREITEKGQHVVMEFWGRKRRFVSLWFDGEIDGIPDWMVWRGVMGKLLANCWLDNGRKLGYLSLEQVSLMRGRHFA